MQDARRLAAPDPRHPTIISNMCSISGERLRGERGADLGGRPAGAVEHHVDRLGRGEELVDRPRPPSPGSRSASGSSRRRAPARRSPRPAVARLVGVDRVEPRHRLQEALDHGRGVRDRVAAAARPLVRRPEERVERAPGSGAPRRRSRSCDDGVGVVAGRRARTRSRIGSSMPATSSRNCAANAATAGDSSISSCTPSGRTDTSSPYDVSTSGAYVASAAAPPLVQLSVPPSLASSVIPRL